MKLTQPRKDAAANFLLRRMPSIISLSTTDKFSNCSFSVDQLCMVYVAQLSTAVPGPLARQL